MMMADIVKFIGDFIEDPQTAILLISFAMAIVAFWRGLIIPKFVYDASEARRVLAEKALTDITEALRDLTIEIRQRGRGRDE